MPGLREEILVVVEAVDVREHGERAAGALELGVLARHLGEDVVAETVLIHVVGEVDPGSVRAVSACVGARVERVRHVRRVAAADRGDDLVVGDPADHLHVDVRVRLLEVCDHVLHDAELAVGEAGPEGQIRRARRRLARPAAAGDHARRKHQEHQSCDRHASHAPRPPREMELENFTKSDFLTPCPDCQPCNDAVVR